MKKNLLLVAAICFLALRSLATVHVITAADNNTFTPSSLSFQLGDTVQWVLASGTVMNHTTTSNTTAPGIPAGAAPWNGPLNAPSGSFMYKPTVVGTYNYHCTFHVSLGMTGSFTVTPPTAVAPVAMSNGISVYPNPASSELNLQFPGSAPTSVVMVNVLGSVVFNTQFDANETLLNMRNIPNGMYYMNITHGDVAFKHEVVITH